MLDQRLRRWPNIQPVLVQRLVLVAMSHPAVVVGASRADAVHHVIRQAGYLLFSHLHGLYFYMI